VQAQKHVRRRRAARRQMREESVPSLLLLKIEFLPNFFS
jgi:hypothetical protein